MFYQISFQSTIT